MGNFAFDRLDSLLKKNRLTRKSLCIATGHADNYIRMFEKRGTEPPREFVKFCADQLGTTSAYLYGETDNPSPAPAAPEQKEKPTVTDDDGLSIQWADVEAAFKAATPEMREAAKAAALAVLNTQKK